MALGATTLGAIEAVHAEPKLMQFLPEEPRQALSTTQYAPPPEVTPAPAPQPPQSPSASLRLRRSHSTPCASPGLTAPMSSSGLCSPKGWEESWLPAFPAARPGGTAKSVVQPPCNRHVSSIGGNCQSGLLTSATSSEHSLAQGGLVRTWLMEACRAGSAEKARENRLRGT